MPALIFLCGEISLKGALAYEKKAFGGHRVSAEAVLGS